MFKKYVKIAWAVMGEWKKWRVDVKYKLHARRSRVIVYLLMTKLLAFAKRGTKDWLIN